MRCSEGVQTSINTSRLAGNQGPTAGFTGETRRPSTNRLRRNLLKAIHPETMCAGQTVDFVLPQERSISIILSACYPLCPSGVIIQTQLVEIHCNEDSLLHNRRDRSVRRWSFCGLTTLCGGLIACTESLRDQFQLAVLCHSFLSLHSAGKSAPSATGC